MKKRLMVLWIIMALILTGCGYTSYVKIDRPFVFPSEKNPSQLVMLATVEGTTYIFGVRANVVASGCYKMTYGADAKPEVPGLDGWADFVGAVCPSK